MPEALDQLSFVYAAYGVGVAGTLLLTAWALLDMRRAEKRRERTREK